MTYWQKNKQNSHTATTKPFLAAKYVLHTSFLSQVLDDSYDAERKTTCSKDEAQLKLPTVLQDYQLVNQERQRTDILCKSGRVVTRTRARL